MGGGGDIRDALCDLVDGVCDAVNRLEGLIDDLVLLDRAARDLDDRLCRALCTLRRLICRGSQLLGCGSKLL